MRNPNGTAKKWLEDHVDHVGDDCLIWPFVRWSSGYGFFGLPPTGAHRYMCELKNGPPPTPQHQAAHSCGRGHDACVHPKHLSWKTNAENQVERYQHSGPVKRTKISPAQVDEIRILKGREKTSLTAKRYGISETTVRDIQSGRSARTSKYIPDDQIRLIRSTPWQVKNSRQWAAEFGVSRGTIERIRQGVSYQWIDADTSQHASAQRGAANG